MVEKMTLLSHIRHWESNPGHIGENLMFLSLHYSPITMMETYWSRWRSNTIHSTRTSL